MIEQCLIIALPSVTTEMARLLGVPSFPRGYNSVSAPLCGLRASCYFSSEDEVIWPSIHMHTCVHMCTHTHTKSCKN